MVGPLGVAVWVPETKKKKRVFFTEKWGGWENAYPMAREGQLFLGANLLLVFQ